jgi:copper chaperone CopZ
MMKWLVVFTALIAFVACSGVDTVEDVNADETLNQDNFSVEPNSVATIEVSGMSCEMGCGGEIRKALKASGAVASTSFDFETDRETNVATVKFDSDDLDEAKIRKIIEGLNDGQFKVGAVVINPLVKESTTHGGNTESTDKPTVSMRSSKFEFPNIFDLLTGFVL